MDLTKFTSGMSAGVDHMSRVEPGDYTASCVAIHQPIEFKQYTRMSQRIDFALEGDGTVLKKYVNLGPAASPWKTIPSKSEYYKVWTAAMGRRPKPGEPMNLDFMVGFRFTVKVEDRKHEDGYTYSLIGKVRPAEQRVEHPDDSVSQSLSNSITQPLNDSVSQVLSDSATQDEMNKTIRAVDSGTQDVGHVETQPLSDSATQDGEVLLIPTLTGSLRVSEEWIKRKQAERPHVRVRERVLDVQEAAYNNRRMSWEETRDELTRLIGEAA